MNIRKILESLISKQKEPSVYAITLRNAEETFLVLETAYSLEEAYEKGKKSIKRKHPMDNSAELVILLFYKAEISELLNGFLEKKEQEQQGDNIHFETVLMSSGKESIFGNSFNKPDDSAQEKKEEVSKNELMKEILAKKDLDFLKQNETRFNAVEYAYLCEEIKKTKKANGTKL